MINLLEHYISRSVPEWGDFSTNPNLRKKVSEMGGFLPFYGNTVVFDLNDIAKAELQKIQEELYHAAGWMLSQKLDPSTFHMTLHDLVNGPKLSDDLKIRIKEAEKQAKPLLAQWQGQRPLPMETTWLFNMVNTSIVLGLRPADAESWSRLDGMYENLETVVPLGYALTPHITMAYFKPGTYSQYDLSCLRKALCPVEMELELQLQDLKYQTFRHMNAYSE